MICVYCFCKEGKPNNDFKLNLCKDCESALKEQARDLANKIDEHILERFLKEYENKDNSG